MTVITKQNKGGEKESVNPGDFKALLDQVSDARPELYLQNQNVLPEIREVNQLISSAATPTQQLLRLRQTQASAKITLL